MTLVELLVVVGIILLLLTLVVPRVQPRIEENRLREAARAVNVFLAAARVRAIESGRPVGVAFERLSEQPNACRVVSQIQFPPPYAGEMLDARVRVALRDPQSGIVLAKVRQGDIADRLIRPGDRIRFGHIGHGGPWFVLAPIDPDPLQGNPDSNGDGFIDFDDGSIQWELDSNGQRWSVNRFLVGVIPEESMPTPALPWPYAPRFGVPVPFVIERMPNLDPGGTGFGSALLRSPVPPLQLPEQVVIDLGGSGIGPNGRDFAVESAAPPLLVIFSPSGTVDEVYCGGSSLLNPFRRVRPVATLFFLIGSWERMPSDPLATSSLAEDGLLNWQHAGNLWVALSPQNGSATVAPVYAGGILGPGGRAMPPDLSTSRRLAQESQVALGGR